MTNPADVVREALEWSSEGKYSLVEAMDALDTLEAQLKAATEARDAAVGLAHSLDEQVCRHPDGMLCDDVAAENIRLREELAEAKRDKLDTVHKAQDMLADRDRRHTEALEEELSDHLERIAALEREVAYLDAEYDAAVERHGAHERVNAERIAALERVVKGVHKVWWDSYGLVDDRTWWSLEHDLHDLDVSFTGWRSHDSVIAFPAQTDTQEDA